MLLYHSLFASDTVNCKAGKLWIEASKGLDGGCEEEYQEYWDWNSRNLRRIGDDWIERMAHPQVNCESYWYNTSTGKPGISLMIAMGHGLVLVDYYRLF